MQQDGFYKTLTIKKINEEVNSFKTFEFEDGHDLNYKSGQYITLVQIVNGKEIRRSYSICSSKELGESLTIGVKRVENGLFSRQLIDDAKPGDKWISTGVGGLFILPNDVDQYEQVFFLAAGSGITPIFSLIKTVLYKHSHLSVELIYSNASPAKTIFLKNLAELKNNFFDRFKLELLYSDNPRLERARLYRELLLELTEKLGISEKAKTLFYICGPEAYMRMCTYTLQAIGVPGSNIKKENFVIYNVSHRQHLPPDKATHQVQIKFGNNNYFLSVEYPDSILKTAQKKGLQLPYSCEVGRCGNCVAQCLQGTIWHSYNEVLTDKELKQGLVLTCVGHPVGGDVELSLNWQG